MARITISAAAKRAGIARQNLYSNYINAGKITVGTDERGNKFIDTAEIIRVFGSLKPEEDDSDDVTQNRRKVTIVNDSQNGGLQVEVRLLREQMADKNEQLQEYRQREQRLLDQVDKLMETIRQIEHKPNAPLADSERPSWLVRVLTHKVW